MKKLMNINEALISVKDGGYSSITTDSDSTASDKINKALLDDIEMAARVAGLKPVITTASSGHPDEGTGKSRHSQQTAVDIAIIDGIGSGGAKDAKSGNATFREKGNKLKDALVSMGYVWNTESGNPKSVLWQTTTGGNHFNHLHVSNTNTDSSPATQSPQTDDSTQKTPEEKMRAVYGDKIIGSQSSENIGAAVKAVKDLGLNEQDNRRKRISVGNENIFSRVSGQVVDGSNLNDCVDSVTIYFVENLQGYYLMYCGIDSPNVGEGQTVKKNSILGYALGKVYMYLYDRNRQLVSISELDTILAPEKGYTKEKKISTKKSALGKAHDRAKNKNLAGYALSMANQVLNPFAKRYDDEGNLVSKGITLNPLKKDFYTQTGLGDTVETWDENKDYKKGSLVKYIGDTYKAKTNIKKGDENPEDNSDWELKKIMGSLSQLYKYSTQDPNKLNEEIQNIKDLMK